MRLSIGALLLAIGLLPEAWPRLIAANRALLARMEAFEQRIEQESAIGRALRPHAQWLLTGWLGAGNERVYPGRGGWLFYRPDVEYVTGRGFLEEEHIERRVAWASEWTTPPQTDPVAAIVAFKRDLDARGIGLVVLPTPVKPVMHPERLDSRLEGPLRNPSYARFREALSAAGVAVFDPADVLEASRGEHYLATDTHWRPEAMELVAERLARFLTARWRLPAPADTGYRIERAEVRNVGDLVGMLDLPADQTLFDPESVWLRRVLNADGSMWRSTRSADVLVLGDSFSNIYALESMGWGTSAGFVEHLSHALGRPVDRIVQNDEGAFATRAILARDPDRLHHTRVVVYQFAERELAFGDWKMISSPREAAGPAGAPRSSVRDSQSLQQ